MNWRRGSFRLWLAISILWISGIIFFRSPITACVKVRYAFELGNPFECFVEDGVISADVLLLAFVPVVALLQMGLICGWIVSGFSRDA